METVTLILTEAIDCGVCSDVLLWLNNPSLLAANEGITDLNLQTQLLPGKIDGLVVVSNASYHYTVSYDETLLLNPLVLLIACDIRQLCCSNCAIQYVDEAMRGISPAEYSVLSGSVDGLDVTVTLTDPTGGVTDYTFSIDDSGTGAGSTVLSDEDSYVDADSPLPRNMDNTPFGNPFLGPVVSVTIPTSVNDMHAIFFILNRVTVRHTGTALNAINVTNQYSIVSSTGPWIALSRRVETTVFGVGSVDISLANDYVDQLDIDILAGNTLTVWSRAFIFTDTGNGVGVDVTELNGEIKVNAFTK